MKDGVAQHCERDKTPVTDDNTDWTKENIYLDQTFTT